jgi:hypothetical protein
MKGIACYKYISQEQLCRHFSTLQVLEDLARNLSEQMKYFAGQVDFAS